MGPRHTPLNGSHPKREMLRFLRLFGGVFLSGGLRRSPGGDASEAYLPGDARSSVWLPFTVV